DVDRGEPLLEQLVVHHRAVLRVALRIVGVRGRIEPLEAVAVVRDEQLPQLASEIGDEVALVVSEPQLERPIPCSSDRAFHSSCCRVAHKPCSWSRKTSSSAFSRVPLDTTARPFW